MANIFIKAQRILLYYDVPEIFIGIDTIGANYLCLLAEEHSDNLHYICTQISGSRLYDVLEGTFDIRSVFEKPELPQVYELQTNKVEQKGNLEIIPLDVLNPAFLPEKGLYLSPPGIENEDAPRGGFSKIALQAAELITHMSEEGQRSAYAAIRGLGPLYPQRN
jgi:hypothetical protein